VLWLAAPLPASPTLLPASPMPLPTGVESNGAGKTALMMAPLWALTGSVDARAEASACACIAFTSLHAPVPPRFRWNRCLFV
jgi:hypothetical protein